MTRRAWWETIIAVGMIAIVGILLAVAWVKIVGITDPPERMVPDDRECVFVSHDGWWVPNPGPSDAGMWWCPWDGTARNFR